MLFTLDTLFVFASPLDFRLSEELGLLVEARPLYAPGAELARRGLAQAELSLLGGNFSQTAVLFGGARVFDPQTEHHLLDLPVPRVEEAKVNLGGASWAAGPGAIAGFLALDPPEPKSEARAWLGEYGLRGAEVSLGNGSAGVLAWAEGFGGYQPGAELARWGVGIPWRGGYLGYQDKRFGAQGFYGPAPSWERTQAALLVAELAGFNLSLRFHRDSFALYRDEPEAYWNLHEKTGLSVNKSLSLGPAFVGFELGWRHLWSTRLGSHQDPQGGVYILRDFGSWGLGARFDAVGLRLAPSFGLWSRFGRLTLSLSQSSRFPSYTELYYESPYNRGNPDLRPEAAFEIRLKGKLSRLEALAFLRRLQDHIAWVKVDSAYEARNLPSFWVGGAALALRFCGALVGLAWAEAQELPLELKYPLLTGPSLALSAGWLDFRWDREKVLLGVFLERWGFKFWVNNILNWRWQETPWLEGEPRSFGVEWRWSG